MVTVERFRSLVIAALRQVRSEKARLAAMTDGVVYVRAAGGVSALDEAIARVNDIEVDE